MAFDSSTLCARTSAGDAELATPSQGLSLGQRRVLTLLENPAAVDELAQQHRLEPEKLARDLTRLAELRLVVLQGPTLAAAQPSLAAQPAPGASAAMAPVVIGSGARRPFTMPLLAGVAVLALAAGLWYGTRGNPAPADPAKPTATAPVPLPAPVAAISGASDNAPTTSADDAAPVAQAPVAALVLRDSATPSAVRPPLPREVVATAPATASVGPVPAAAPKAVQRPETAGTPSAPVPATTAPAAAPLAAPAAATAPSAAPAADTAPSLQVAAAAPSSSVPRPAAVATLKPISREAPDFPKEAIAEGYKSGTVIARLHVDARGSVTGVDIISAQPPRVFDRAVRRTLLRWQFEPNAAGQPTDLDVDVNFQRD